MDTKTSASILSLLPSVLTLASMMPVSVAVAQISPSVPLKLSDEEGTTEEVLYLWDSLWYLRGTGAYDPIGNVDGGVIGSSAFKVPDLFSNPPSSDWYFIEGSYLFLKPRNGGVVRFTGLRGSRVSCEDGNCDAPIEADGRDLSGHLRDIYHRSRGFRVGRHTPFFNRGDWDTTTTTSDRASSVQVQAFAESMHFEVAYLPHNGVFNTQGRVMYQKPLPGTLLPRNGVVAVELDGSTVTVDTPVKIEDADFELTVPGQERWVEIDLNSPDIFKSTSCPGTAREQIFKLPNVAGQTVTVYPALGTVGEIAISAWYIDDAGLGRVEEVEGDKRLAKCIRGVQPVLEFIASPPTNDQGEVAGTYVVVEHAERETSTFFIRVNWLAPESKNQNGEQSN